MRTLIRGGTVVTAAESFAADVLVEDERIALLGTDLAARVGAVERVVDATGRLVVPGGVDVHTHLDLPVGDIRASDDFETGTIAAAFGGTTSIVDFASQPRAGSLRAGLDEWLRLAEGKAAIDFGFHMSVREINERVLDEMEALVRDGVTSFKLFTAYPGVWMLDDASILRALQRCASIGAVVCMHCENGPGIQLLVEQALAAGQVEPRHHARTRPARFEAEATARVLALAEVAGAALHVVHVSAAEALDEVRAARARGVRATAETCPQYLFLSDDLYDAPFLEAAKYVMSPPLRPRGNERRLWEGLANGDLQLVATDHCPFTLEQKRRGESSFARIPNGAPGIETRLQLLWDGGVRAGRITPSRWVELVSTAPAKLFGMYPRKGSLAPGADADIVVWNPEAEAVLSARTHHMRVDYSPYEGRVVRGAAETVLSRGRVVVDAGRWTGAAGRGRFVARAGV